MCKEKTSTVIYTVKKKAHFTNKAAYCMHANGRKSSYHTSKCCTNSLETMKDPIHVTRGAHLHRLLLHLHCGHSFQFQGQDGYTV